MNFLLLQAKYNFVPRAFRYGKHKLEMKTLKVVSKENTNIRQDNEEKSS